MMLQLKLLMLLIAILLAMMCMEVVSHTVLLIPHLLIVYQFLLLSLHKITTSGCGIRPTTH